MGNLGSEGIEEKTYFIGMFFLGLTRVNLSDP